MLSRSGHGLPAATAYSAAGSFGAGGNSVK